MDRYDYRRGYNRKRKLRRRTRNRIIIVVTGIALLIIAIILISALARAIFKPRSQPVDNDIESASESISESAPPATENLLSATTFVKPDIKDDGSDGIDSGSIYVWERKAFELFFGGESAAQRYAELMNKASAELGSGVKVYSMIVPNHTEFGLPERLKGDGGAQTTDQAEYLRYAYAAMDSAVTPVNPYNKLSEHCNEYIYFNSDHHWSGLGAYYSYTAFAETAGLPVLSLSDCTENVIDGFTGTLMKMTSAEVDTDSVHYWTFPYDVTDSITESGGGTYDYDSCYYEYAEAGDNTYGVFLMGDNPLEVIRSSSDAVCGEKIAVIHESYGNAFVPYLTYNYDEVYSIDFRSWGGDLSEFCAENGITNVLFLNGVMSSATQVQLDSIEYLL